VKEKSHLSKKKSDKPTTEAKKEEESDSTTAPAEQKAVTTTDSTIKKTDDDKQVLEKKSEVQKEDGSVVKEKKVETQPANQQWNENNKNSAPIAPVQQNAPQQPTTSTMNQVPNNQPIFNRDQPLPGYSGYTGAASNMYKEVLPADRWLAPSYAQTMPNSGQFGTNIQPVQEVRSIQMV